MQGDSAFVQQAQALMNTFHHQVGGVLLADKFLQNHRHQGANARIQVLGQRGFQLGLADVPLQGLIDQGLLLLGPRLRGLEHALVIRLLTDLLGLLVRLLQCQVGLLVQRFACLVGLG
ncbi:hypothetical protein EY04_27680 [Pseudomonas chlororaphis]|nr:hypothetical protein EY04_27680 [Pseudomonas chlororaphis]